MIPKIIHYCWFGKNPLPELAQICISSWKKYLPEYEILEWNEDNFDIHCCKYVEEAYENKKWAFVSDYARFKILYEYGGIYFDTDVEMIKPIDDILATGPFMGCEAGTGDYVAPGLGLAVMPKHPFYKKMLDLYESIHFILPDGTQNLVTIVKYTTNFLIESGWNNPNEIQKVEGIYIYPDEYFCPINCVTAQRKITNNTRTIHYYTDSWGSYNKAKVLELERKFDQKGKFVGSVGRVLILPLRIINKIKQVGLLSTIKHALKKLLK